VLSILATHVLTFAYNVGMNTNRGRQNGHNSVGEHSDPAPSTRSSGRKESNDQQLRNNFADLLAVALRYPRT
jgi:hypothetical protein